MTKVVKALSSFKLSTFQIVHLGECGQNKLFHSDMISTYIWFSLHDSAGLPITTGY